MWKYRITLTTWLVAKGSYRRIMFLTALRESFLGLVFGAPWALLGFPILVHVLIIFVNRTACMHSILYQSTSYEVWIYSMSNLRSPWKWSSTTSIRKIQLFMVAMRIQRAPSVESRSGSSIPCPWLFHTPCQSCQPILYIRGFAFWMRSRWR